MLANYKIYLDKALLGLMLVAAVVLLGKYGSTMDQTLKATIQGFITAAALMLMPPQSKIPATPVPPASVGSIFPPPVVTDEEVTK